MKRIITSFVALWLILAGTGLTVYQHYCHGEFAGSSVGVAQSVCASCGMADQALLKSKCCQTDVQFFQVKSEGMQSLWTPTPLVLDLAPLVQLEPIAYPHSIRLELPHAQAPPNPQRPIWMRLGVYLS